MPLEELPTHAELVQILDVRERSEWEAGHIPGSAFTAWHDIDGMPDGLDPEREIVFVGRDDEDGRVAARLAVSVGLRTLGGYLHGGMTSWRQEKRPIQRVQRMPLEELPTHAELVQILDVRERSEWDAGHIPGSAFTAWHDIDGMPDGLDPERPIAVVCGSGQRAAVAASLIARAGAREVIHVVEGGVPKWGRLGQPLTRD
jgi:hydroxyacylglutathione hydrolase